MTTPNLTCPVCGSLPETGHPEACPRCDAPNPFVVYFSGKQAYDQWQTTMEAAKLQYQLRRRGHLRQTGQLVIGSEQIVFLDSSASQAVLFARGQEPRRMKNIRQFSASNLHQALLQSDGTVAVQGDNEYGQRQANGMKNVIHVLAAPRCTYVVSKNGSVSAKGACALQDAIAGWKDIRRLACGSTHLVGLTGEGTLMQADTSSTGRTQEETAGWQNVTAIAAAADYTLALHADGTVSYAGPVPDTKQEVSQWRNIVAIAADSQYAVGLTESGDVLLAGRCLSSFVDMNRSSARQWKNIGLIAAGRSVIGAVTNDGQLLLAGNILGADELTAAFGKTVPKILP
jgi:alpha-tubulin suppressor-like RCC1 family protein